MTHRVTSVDFLSHSTAKKIGDIGMGQNENFEIGFLLTTHGEDKGNRHELHYFGRSLKGPFELIFDKEENDIPCLCSTVTVLDFFQ